MQVSDAAMLEALQCGDVDGALLIAAALDLRDEKAPVHRPTVLGAALWYAERGLPVFPCMSLSKKPYPRSHGLDDATTDPDQIRAMFGDKPGANLAIATGHRVDVIDIDGLAGHIAWGNEWPTWADAGIDVLGTVSTPRPGGLHVYVPATGRGNRAGMVDHVDYRGLGGYVLVPPSSTTTGRYCWLTKLPDVLP